MCKQSVILILSRPNVMDLSSTNGTTVNGKALQPGEWQALKKGDVLKFGCSTRDYVVKTK